MGDVADFGVAPEPVSGVGSARRRDPASAHLRLLGTGDASRAAITQRVAELETTVYVTLIGLDEEALRLAEAAEAMSLPDEAIRARLLHSDVLSRRGRADEAMRLQLSLHDRATAEGRDLLVARANLYLASTADRLGERADCLRWADAAQLLSAEAPPGWRAEALMVLVMFTVSHIGFTHELLEHALEDVRAVGNPVLTTVTLANLAEVATECDDVVLGLRLVAEAISLLGRHPSASAALTWESIARVQMAAGDVAAADVSLRTAFRIGADLGWCDVNGDPYLTLAELRLAQGRSRPALSALVHPDRAGTALHSSWVATRELEVRAKILATLGRWREAYDAMVDYVSAYEKVRSVEAERAAVHSQSAQTAEEERRRASKFEQLSLRDSLTGHYNRRYVDERLSALTVAAAGTRNGRLPALVSVAILDVDHFKSVNDTYSHDVGDLVLIRLSGLLLANVCDNSHNQPFAARLGGEEFVLVLPGISHADAIAECEAVLERLRRTSFADLAPGLAVRASIGLVTVPTPIDKAAVLRTADACLYEAKRAGRDRLVATG